MSYRTYDTTCGGANTIFCDRETGQDNNKFAVEQDSYLGLIISPLSTIDILKEEVHERLARHYQHRVHDCVLITYIR